jgi:DNA polymerase-3 subunit alpha
VNKLKSMELPKEQFDKYVERLKYEIKVISDIGAMGYFKVVADAVKLANDNNIYTGAGRGSAAASLLFYLL